jgi:large subunit ribosomal protein L35
MIGLKTHSGAKKRFKFLSRSKIIRAHANKNHILNKKSRKRKRNLRHATFVHKSDIGRIKRMMPYSF